MGQEHKTLGSGEVQPVEPPSGDNGLYKMAECFLGFGVDPSENIAKLTKFCGEFLRADSAMYDRMDGTKMTRLGGWNLPQDSTSVGFGRGSSGYDSIKMGHADIFEIQHMDKSPGVADRKHLHTYLGRIVKDKGMPVGALSVLFHQIRTLSEQDREVLGIVAAAIAIEDKRLKAEQTVATQQQTFVSTAKMSALGEMAAGVAHEINNPLLAMLMRIEQLRDTLAPVTVPEDVIKIVNALEHLTMRISKIVKSLRTFSGDTQDEPFRSVDIQEVIDATVEFCGERFRQHQVDFQIINPGNPKIQCRPTELSRVFLNLLQNSFDAIEPLASKWIKVEVQEKEGGLVEISVTDSGTGILGEIQDKIFLPFFSTKDVNKGKGLGLSVARGIIEKHNGKLDLNKNNPNTRFVIQIPAKQKGFVEPEGL